MTAQLSAAEAATVVAAYQGAAAVMQNAGDRIVAGIRELDQLNRQPLTTQERPSDLVVTNLYTWRSGNTDFRPVQIGASLDRLRVTFITGGAPTPIIMGTSPFTLTDASNDLLTGGLVFLPTPPVVINGSDFIFGTKSLTLATRAALYLAPFPGTYLGNEDTELCVIQEFTVPQSGTAGQQSPPLNGAPATPGCC